MPRHRPRNPLGFSQGAILITLILLPAVLKVHSDRSNKSASLSDYQTGSAFIRTKIDSSAGNQDVATLLRLHGKYAGGVTDSKFEGALQGALGKASDREAQLELAVSKNLDVTRHREELGARARLVPTSAGGDAGPTLSKLPR